MFDIGFLELAVIMVLALLVLGPERLPKAARTVGHYFGKARRYVEGMKAQVEAEFDSTEVKRLLHNQEIQIREMQSKLQNAESYVDTDYHNQFENTEDPATTHAEMDLASKAEKPAGPQYEMIERDDDRWDDMEDIDPPIEKALEKSAEEKNTLDKAQ